MTGEEAAASRVRLFVAIEVPEEVRVAVGTAVMPLQERAPALRWVPCENYHLTLAFLGWVPDDRVAAAKEAVASAAAATGPFSVRLPGTLGSFRSGVLWAAVEAGAALDDLAERLRLALLAAGFALEDRPFRCHLTLARAAKGGRVPRALASGAAVADTGWEVHEVALMRSSLSPQGARYERLHRFRLGGA